MRLEVSQVLDEMLEERYLNLSDLALRTGEHYERSYDLEIAPITLGGVPYRVVLSQGMGVAVARVVGGFIVTVASDATIYGPCSRCLADVVLDVHAEQEEFAPTAQGGWKESDLSAFISGLVVDVAGIAREAVVLSLPSQVLCSASCLGLCPQCGWDLNKGPCGCSRDPVDERWAKLKELRLPHSAGV